MVWLGVLFGVPSWFVYQVVNYGDPEVWQILLLPATIIAGIITPFGFQAVAPNDARALLLFGNYVGSITESGFYLGESVLLEEADFVASAKF